MVEVIRHDRGTGWVAEHVAALVETHRPLAVILDGGGAAQSLIPDLETRAVKLTLVTAKEHAAAAGHLFDLVCDQRLVHLGQHPLDAAVRGATKRPLGGAWAWNRATSGVDLCPLVAVTLALLVEATVIGLVGSVIGLFSGVGLAVGLRSLLRPQ